MQLITDGYPLTVLIEHVAPAGAVTPPVVSGWVEDERGNRAMVVANVTASSLTSTTMTINQLQVLGPNVDQMIATFRATISWHERLDDFERLYLVRREGANTLTIMGNSFQTYAEAMSISMEYANLSTFLAETKERQSTALIEAYRRICQLPLIFDAPRSENRLGGSLTLSNASWDEMTLAEFDTLPVAFRRVLRAAQVLEADELLQGNVMAQKHAQGIASETIGESSITLRPGFSATSMSQGGVSHAAAAILAPYINRSVRIGRA